MNVFSRAHWKSPLLLILSFLLVGVFLMPSIVYSQEEGESHESALTGEHEEHKESGFHHLGIFLGVTDKEHETPVFTTGLDYAYRLAPPVGLVALTDNPQGDFRDWIIAAGFSVYPLAESFIFFAPGIEVQEDKEAEVLFRIGVGYDFIVTQHRFYVAPSFNVDFVDDEIVYVYGLGLGVELGR